MNTQQSATQAAKNNTIVERDKIPKIYAKPLSLSQKLI